MNKRVLSILVAASVTAVSGLCETAVSAEETEEKTAAAENASLESADDSSEKSSKGFTEVQENEPLDLSAIEEEKEEPRAERGIGTESIPDVQAALEAALETQQIRQYEQMPEPQPEPVEMEQTQNLEEIELAMPVKNVEELLQEAYTAGDDPVVEEDAVTGVTFVDYSDCL